MVQTVFAPDLAPKMTFILLRFGCICYYDVVMKKAQSVKIKSKCFSQKSGGGATQTEKSKATSLSCEMYISETTLDKWQI